MISIQLARDLRDAGVAWHPVPGDAFRIDRPDFQSETFTISDLTVEAHEFDTGTILGFNGTTEWALDSVALEDAIWLPREDQLREMLGTAFRSLTRVDEVFRVEIVPPGRDPARFDALGDPADAYALAVLDQLNPDANPSRFGS